MNDLMHFLCSWLKETSVCNRCWHCPTVTHWHCTQAATINDVFPGLGAATANTLGRRAASLLRDYDRETAAVEGGAGTSGGGGGGNGASRGETGNTGENKQEKQEKTGSLGGPGRPPAVLGSARGMGGLMRSIRPVRAAMNALTFQTSDDTPMHPLPDPSPPLDRSPVANPVYIPQVGCTGCQLCVDPELSCFLIITDRTIVDDGKSNFL